MEGCWPNAIGQLVYAISLPDHGYKRTFPYRKSGIIDQLSGFYTATNKANILISHVWGRLCSSPAAYPCFFNFYGPWKNPDMPPILFVDAMLGFAKIKDLNDAYMVHYLTHIEDMLKGLT